MRGRSLPHAGRPPAPLELSEADQGRLRTAQLDLLAEFDRVCRANGLEYFALYGTLLGAVRHGGFIPWDDDLDLGMLRPDFDRLMEVSGTAFGPDYFFQTVRTDPAYGCMFGKLRRNGTHCVDLISYGSPQHDGIFIDVFPLDGKATTPLARIEQRFVRMVGFRLLYLKAGYAFMTGTSVRARIAQTLFSALGRLIPKRALVAELDRHTRLADTNPEQYVSLFGAYVYDRDTLDAAWVHPLTELPFEDMTIPVFADSDAYLTQLYGDYLQPPPKELQTGHHNLVELDFDGTRP